MSLSLTFLSWNIAGNLFSNSIIDDIKLILLDNPNLFCFCIQEIGPTEETTKFGIPERFNEWKTSLLNFLKPNYKLISSESCGGVVLFIFENLNCKINISYLETKFNFLGNEEIPPNKASICIKLLINSKLIFSIIGNHLEAYDEKYNIRNKQLLEAIELSKESDYIIILGDLNYRIDMNYERSCNLSYNNNIKELIKRDQLKRSISENIEFSNILEEEIQFLPTYKYDLNSNLYDTSEKKRIPSYTDRIIYIINNNNKLPIINNYNRIENKFSDHRAVYLKMLINF